MRKSWLARIIHGLAIWHHNRNGWQQSNANPGLTKCVVIAAPHTSNWDFIHFLGASHDLGVHLSFAGKKQLFRWPFSRAMKELGGVPVDRSKSTNFVDAMIAEFASRDYFMLTIAPEGTRDAVQKWKTGFYHIAVGAKVPLVLGMMDYPKKQVGLGPAFMPTGDYAADMKKVAEFYSGITPKHPRQGSVDFGNG